MLETYQAYGTYHDSAVMTREVIQEVAEEVFGTRTVSLPDGSTYDLDGQWQSIQMYPSLSEALGEDITPQTPVERLSDIAKRIGLEVPADRPYGHGKLVEAGLIDPELTTVVLNTGDGLKTLDAVADSSQATATIRPSLDAFRDAGLAH